MTKFTFTLQSRYFIFVIYGICFWFYMLEIYLWLALLLLHMLASIIERFLSAIYIYINKLKFYYKKLLKI